MFLRCLLLGLLFARIRAYFSEERSPEESKVQPPTVVVAILARNSAHSLPYYLGALERLNYPKDRISVWWVFLRAQSGGALRTMLMLAVHAFFLGCVKFCAVITSVCGDPVNIERNSTEVCLISTSQQLKNLRDEIFLFLLLLSSLSVHLLGPAPGSFLFSSIGSSRWLQPKNLLGVLLACQKLTGSCWGLSLLSPSVQQLGLEQFSVPPPSSTLHNLPSRSGAGSFGGSFWKA